MVIRKRLSYFLERRNFRTTWFNDSQKRLSFKRKWKNQERPKKYEK